MIGGATRRHAGTQAPLGHPVPEALLPGRRSLRSRRSQAERGNEELGNEELGNEELGNEEKSMAICDASSIKEIEA